MTDLIADTIRGSWTNFLYGVQIYLPRVLAALSILIVGWFIAWMLSYVLRHVLRWLRFDRLVERSGISDMLKRVGFPSAVTLISSTAFWMVWLTFMLSGVAALGFAGMEGLAVQFVAFLPRILVAAIIVAVGLVTANFAWRATLLASVNANLPSARAVSSLTRWLIIVLAIAMALEQIGVAKAVVLTAFAIAFGALMLGVGIAIGIGGAPIARRVIERQFPDRTNDVKETDDMSHL
jgi:hypothetical protein